jgi:hypothetical protein
VKLNLIFLITALMTLGSSAQGNDSVIKFLDTLNRLNQSGDIRCPLADANPRPTDEATKWTAAGFPNPAISTLNLSSENDPSDKYTHEFSPSLVMFRNTGWNEDILKSSFSRVAEIYRQCGIRLGSAKLVMVNAPNSWLDLDGDRDTKIAAMTPEQTDRPILYFLRSEIGAGRTAYAYRLGIEGYTPLLDTVWITNDINTASYKKLRDPKYSPIAHELAHILGDRSHIEGDEKNILGNSPETVNDQITKEQCDAFKRHPSMRKL